jgi:hypothetical protein
MKKPPFIEDIFNVQEIKNINKWIAIYHNKLLFFMEKKAIQKFNEFDEIYCKRVGCTQQDLFDVQIEEAKRRASLSFTDIDNEFGDTVFKYAESERQSAYKKFEEKYLLKRQQEENKYPFRVFVAIELGLIRRKHLWW